MEKMIARQCGPALAGIKTANLVSVDKLKHPEAVKELMRLNTLLNKKGICFETLCECEKRMLVMVYRPQLLKSYLSGEEIRGLLSSFGYPHTDELSVLLGHLKKRMHNSAFPHEIGAFLGYPVEDIRGFINHKDKGLLFIGEWKVYSNPERAKKYFSRYSACRRALVRHIDSGKALGEIFKAA